ncbi:protein of unknown function (plasmid) [Rhodovastum atsumiense]|nr:protein of unknown function [Rhodovastum atsumiense]
MRPIAGRHHLSACRDSDSVSENRNEPPNVDTGQPEQPCFSVRLPMLINALCPWRGPYSDGK